MIVALNNKSNLTKEEFQEYQQQLQTIETFCNVIICPSMLHIASWSECKINLGSQNVSKEESGAHTGEVAASQLKSYGVKYCLVGHSERRQEQQESSHDVSKKIKQLLKENIIPILCVGENELERKENRWSEVVTQEIIEAISDLTPQEKNKIILAYEPIWSIGTGMIPTVPQIEEVFQLIKEQLPENKILYGGSVNQENINELKISNLIDGYLLGGLSLKPNALQTFFQKLEN